MNSKKTVINFHDANIVAETYMEASGICGGWTRKPLTVEYVRNQQNWDGISLFTDNKIDNVFSVKSPIKVAWLLEPFEYNPYPYNRIKQIEDQFNFVLTYDKELLERNKNKYKFIPPNFTFVDKESFGLHNKSKLISTIFSSKNFMVGHALRHEVANMIIRDFPSGTVDMFGSGCGNKIHKKSDSLNEYMFQIVIENVKRENFFTEKIIDCFVTGTIPIYWGCPNINNFFNEKGIITFNTIEELKQILLDLKKETYNDMFHAMKDNYDLTISKYTESDDEILKLINSYLLDA